MSPDLQPFKLIQHELYTVNGCILRSGDRFIIPKSLIPRVIRLAHDSHPGMTRTKQRIRELYWWPKLNATVEESIKDCIACQSSDKSAKPVQAPIQPVEYPAYPMGKVSIDVCGPYGKASFVMKYKTILIHYYSRWPEMLKTEKALTSGQIIGWLKTVFGRFGSPEYLVPDNGTIFVRKVFESFLKKRGIHICLQSRLEWDDRNIQS